MSAFTYVAGGVLLCAVFGGLTNQHFSLLALGCAALGALTPDWLEQTWLTERFGSKTITHSLLGLVFVGLALSPLLLTHSLTHVLTGVLLGYAAHLLLDAATPHGVLLLYPSRIRAVIPRHVLSRIEPHSPRERLLRRWLLGVLVIALWLNAIGIRRLLHQCIPVVQFAVEDYVALSSQGRRVMVDFTGRFNASQRPVSGRWEVLDATSRTSLLVEDADGIRYTLGTHPHDTILAFQVHAKPGPKAQVILRSVRLREQPLSDVLAFIPPNGTTYLIGTVHLDEPLAIHVPVDQFESLRAGPRQLELRYATLRDLQAQHLTHVHITEGELLVRTITERRGRASKDGVTFIPATPPSRRSKILTVVIPHLQDAEELLVEPDQEVVHGQFLADLRNYRAELLPKSHAAFAQLAAAKAALAQQDLTFQDELALKRIEDALTGLSRPLASLHARRIHELEVAQARLQAIDARLEVLDHELASTTIVSPATGRVISIHVTGSTATLRILVND